MLWADDLTPPDWRLLCVHLTSNSSEDNHVLAARPGWSRLYLTDPVWFVQPPRSVDLERSRNKKISKPMQTTYASMFHKDNHLSAREHSSRVVKAVHFRRVRYSRLGDHGRYLLSGLHPQTGQAGPKTRRPLDASLFDQNQRSTNLVRNTLCCSPLRVYHHEAVRASARDFNRS
jgi:hypothetical protein